MAKSKFEYTRNFEVNDSLLQHTWIVVRIDGQGFHKFTDAHNFSKPNDDFGLGLMNKAALEVLKVTPDISLAYGQSDEYSFVFKRDSVLHNRRASKLISTIVSRFTANYLFFWPEFFPGQQLLYPPSFDARAVCYPSIEALRDYLSWRQADCHINNLYNICFWKLVQDGETKQQAQLILKVYSSLTHSYFVRELSLLTRTNCCLPDSTQTIVKHLLCIARVL
ncbi:tRNA-His guanylyltransferase, variant 4 [Entomophthora muscae]|uniref:tRNA-His guanylyltransferase, variant 4 n=1 Tax=Entomophthora muscae TaxID=34485 RepID=A0ACC2TI11_9FUNG|nr:tRNA-His guanylyltransferase, variant 4 [Entomophthora muscae]